MQKSLPKPTIWSRTKRKEKKRADWTSAEVKRAVYGPWVQATPARARKKTSFFPPILETKGRHQDTRNTHARTTTTKILFSNSLLHEYSFWCSPSPSPFFKALGCLRETDQRTPWCTRQLHSLIKMENCNRTSYHTTETPQQHTQSWQTKKRRKATEIGGLHTSEQRTRWAKGHRWK